ncbi:hypothetical protein [Halosegnis sp.]|uniref:hypothetical protein n=1 Tax=Halosegnis sp. TaxID=2864959 RepID=UPI0035D425FA
MSLQVDVARASALLNMGLLLALALVWGRNYLQIRSKQTLGTLVFSVVLFGENALALYYYVVTAAAVPAPAMQAMMILSLLETVALAFLVYVTYD